MDLAVCIGGYVVQIQEPENHPYSYLAPPALRHIPSFTLSTIRSLCKGRSRCTSSRAADGPLRFDSAHGCWKLFESDSGLLFESLDPKNFQPRVRARVSDDYRTLRAWILPDLQGGQVGWSPDAAIQSAHRSLPSVPPGP